MALVSVIIPAYNRAQFIGRALESVLCQSMAHLEALVVDDGSTDETPTVARDLAARDQRVRLLTYPKNRGAQAARNVGIRAARGPWIAFLDSDDQWLPESLERRLARGEGTGAPVVHSACRVRAPDGKLHRHPVPPLAGHVWADLLRRPGPVFPALLVKRDAMYRAGLLDESLVSWQEWDTAIRLARRSAFAFEPSPSFIYERGHHDTISADLHRNARGYEQLVSKHRLAMLARCGPSVLSRHYETLAATYEEAGDIIAAERCRGVALLYWPLRPRGFLRRLRDTLTAPRTET